MLKVYFEGKYLFYGEDKCVQTSAIINWSKNDTKFSIKTSMGTIISNHPLDETVDKNDLVYASKAAFEAAIDNFFVNASVAEADRDADGDQLGYKIIPKDFDFANIPVNYANSIWEIRYEHDEVGNSIVLPSGVVIFPNGGVIKNATSIQGDNTQIIAAENTEVFKDIGGFSGTWLRGDININWFGVKLISEDSAPFLENIFSIFDRSDIDLNGNEFKLSSAVNITSRIKYSIKNGTFKPDANIGTVLNISNCHSFELGVKIDGQSTKQSFGVKASACSDLRIKESRVFDFGDSTSTNVRALFIEHSPYTFIEKCKFENITSSSSSSSRAIVIGDTTSISNGCVIRDSEIKNVTPVNDADGIFLYTLTGEKLNCLIDNVHFYDCAKRFIKVQAGGVTIQNCVGVHDLVGDMSFCIDLQTGSGFKVVNNTFTSLSGRFTSAVGMAVGVPIEDVRITGNEFYNTVNSTLDTAIEAFEGVEKLWIQNNFIKGFRRALEISEPAITYKDVFFENNVLDEISDHAIIVGNITNFIVKNNHHKNTVINRNLISVAAASTLTSVVVKDNTHNYGFGTITDRIATSNNNYVEYLGVFDGFEYDRTRKINYRNSLPTTGVWEVADKIINKTPSATAYAGWVCVTAGDFSGTPPIFKGFGLIES